MRSSSKRQGERTKHGHELDELFSRLEVASGRLNAAAHHCTRRIEALEERLVAAEPGVESWGATLLTEQTTFQREGSEVPVAAERVVRLGYAKVKKDKWGIAVREVFKSPSSELLSDKSSLLLKSERHLRLLALPHLTSLTRQIVEKLEAQTAGLEDVEDDAADDADVEAPTADDD
jgi:hypothetical protein